MWTVVRKTDHNEYDALPNIWILDDNKTAKYPLNESLSVIYQYAKEAKDLEDYEVIMIEVIKKDYAAMDDSIRLCHGKRCLSSSEREVKGRGQRKKFLSSRAHCSSPSESENEYLVAKKAPKSTYKEKSCISEYQEILKNKSIPKPPPPPPPPPPAPSAVTNKKTHAENRQNEAVVTSPGFAYFVDAYSSRASGLSTPKSKKSNSRVFSTPTSAKKTLFPSPASKQHFSGQSKCKLSKKLKHTCGYSFRKCSREDAVIHVLCSISCEVEKIKRDQKLARVEAANRPTNENNDDALSANLIEESDTEIPEEVKSLLPLETVEELNRFEHDLKQNKDLFEKLVKMFVFKCRYDTSAKKSARNIVRDLIHEELLTKFSLRGGHSSIKESERKMAFISLQLYSLLNKAVKCLWKKRCSSYESEVLDTLGPFLTQNKPKRIHVE